MKLWSEWLQATDSKGSTVSQFHSFTEHVWGGGVKSSSQPSDFSRQLFVLRLPSREEMRGAREQENREQRSENREQKDRDQRIVDCGLGARDRKDRGRESKTAKSRWCGEQFSSGRRSLLGDRQLEHHGTIVRQTVEMIGKLRRSFLSVFSMGWGSLSRTAHLTKSRDQGTKGPREQGNKEPIDGFFRPLKRAGGLSCGLSPGLRLGLSYLAR